MNKKKFIKIVGAIAGISAICCIIPSCVVSCGSSSSANDNSANDNNESGTLIAASASSSNSNLTPESNIVGQLGISQSQNPQYYSLINESIVAYACNESTANTTYTLTLNNLPFSSSGATYEWFSISSSNIGSETSLGNTSNLQTDFVSQLISAGGNVVSNQLTYTFNGPLAADGNGYACEIEDNGATYYSQIVFLAVSSANSSSPQSTSSSSTSQNNNQSSNSNPSDYNDPLELTGSNYTLSLNNSLESVDDPNNDETYIVVPKGTTVNLSLSISNYTYTNFNNYNYSVAYTVQNQNSDAIPTVTTKLLSNPSAWNFSFTPTAGITTISVSFSYNDNPINMIASGNGVSGDEFGVCNAQIEWNPAETSVGGSDTLTLTSGLCLYPTATYYWQSSTNNGKTWNNIANATGTFTDYNTAITNSQIADCKINDIDNNTTLYRLEIVNSSDSSEIFYSNTVTANDSLIASSISFNNSNYEAETKDAYLNNSAIISTSQKEFTLNVTLNQYGKLLTDKKILDNLTASLLFNNSSFSINLNNLSQYLQPNGHLLIPVNIQSVLENINKNSVSAATTCSVKLSINQNSSNIYSNSLNIQFEEAKINLASFYRDINGVYNVNYNETIKLNSSGSNISFASGENNGAENFQWQTSNDGKTWEDVSNANSSTFSGSNPYDTTYWRLQITSVYSSVVEIYSNVLEISADIPTVNVSLANGSTNLITSSLSYQPIELSVSQFGNQINSSSSIQVFYQRYNNLMNEWENLSTGENFDVNSAIWNYQPQSGINKLRIECIFDNSIPLTTNEVVINEIAPTIIPENLINSPNNANNYLTNNAPIYSYTTGSVVMLNLSSTDLFTSTLQNYYDNEDNGQNTTTGYYDINCIQWYKVGNNNPIVTYGNFISNDSSASSGSSYSSYEYESGDFIGLSCQVLNDCQYYAVIQYRQYDDNYPTSLVTFKTNKITLNAVDNGTTLNIELANCSSMQNYFQQNGQNYDIKSNEGHFGQYFFFDMSEWYKDYENLVGDPQFNLNIYDNGKQLSADNLNSNQKNWTCTWYIQEYSSASKTWGSEITLASTASLNSSNSWSFMFSNILDYLDNNPFRIACVVSTASTEMYSNWYYFLQIPSLNVHHAYI